MDAGDENAHASSALRRDDDFWSVERLSVRVGERALEPAEPHEPAERLRVEPVLSRLASGSAEHSSSLRSTTSASSGT